jgi:hypothetical protein
VTERDVNKIVDDVATSIKRLANELEIREKDGEILKAAEIRAVADQLRSHVKKLLSAVSRLREKGPGR